MSLYGDDWVYIARRAPEPSAAESFHAGGPEASRQANRIEWQDLTERADGRRRYRSLGGRRGRDRGRARHRPGRRSPSRLRDRQGPRHPVRRSHRPAPGHAGRLRRPRRPRPGSARPDPQPLRATHGEDVDWWETQSDIGIAMTTSIDDMGDGFFVDQESEVARAPSREEERGRSAYGITLGRWIADAAPSPPTPRPSLILSGLVDLGVQIADPSHRARQAGGPPDPSHLRAADLATEADAGIIRTCATSSTVPTAASWLDGRNGAARLRWIAGVLAHSHVDRLQPQDPPRPARRLADEAHTPGVRAILEPELGTRIVNVGTVEMPLQPHPLVGEAYRDPFRAAGAPGTHAGAPGSTPGTTTSWLARSRHGCTTPRPPTTRSPPTSTRWPAPRTRSTSTPPSVTPCATPMASSPARGIADQNSATGVAISQTAQKRKPPPPSGRQSSQTPTYNDLVAGGVPVHDVGANLYVEHARHLTLPDGRNVRRAVSDHGPP